MLVLWVQLKVKPQCRDRFVEVASTNARASLRDEPGDVLRFDVIQDSADPDRFYYYEIYAGQEAMDRHNRTPHRLAYGAAVEDLLAEPLAAVRGSEIVVGLT